MKIKLKGQQHCGRDSGRIAGSAEHTDEEGLAVGISIMTRIAIYAPKETNLKVWW